jgi:hypothetical protein
MKKLLLPLLVSSMAIVAGCSEAPLDVIFARHASAGHERYQVFIDPAFPDRTIPVIEEAINDWQVSLRSYVAFDVAVEHSDCSTGERVICVKMARPGEVSDGQAGLASYGPLDRSIVRISTDNFSPEVANWRECTRITATHELGHVMGLRHDRAGTIMSPNGTYVAEHITARDVRQFFRVHGRT